MKRKNGFTLIELLAVIVILAIIALIATPMILGIIESAKKGAVESSTYGYIAAVEKSELQDMIDTGNYITKKDGTYDLTTIGTVKYKGKQPSQICVVMKDGSVESGEFKFDNYIVEYKEKKAKVNELKNKIVCEINGEVGEPDYIPTSKIMAEREWSPYFLSSEISRENIESIRFIKTSEFPDGAIDISEAQNGSVMLWYIDSDQNGLNEITIGGIDGVLANENSSFLFATMTKINLIDLSEFYTNGVINMADMFSQTGSDSTIFTLDLGNHFNTSDVTNMNSMFSRTGFSSLEFSLKLGDKFATSNVNDMRSMFELTGVSNPNFTLDLRTFHFKATLLYTNLLPSFPANNLIIVKNQTVKDWILEFVRSDLTNIQIAS